MKKKLTPYLLIAPVMFLLLAFGVLPILVAGVVSLTDLDLAGLGDWNVVQWIGLRELPGIV